VNSYQLENLIVKILSGKQIIRINNEVYELRPYSSDLKLEASWIYESSYSDHLYDESFISQDDAESMLYDMGILYAQFDGDVKSVEKNIENNKVDLYNNFFDRTQKKQIKQKIISLNKRYSQLLSYKHMLDFLTLENYCSNIKNSFLICNSLYFYKTNNLVFNFNNTDNVLFDRVTTEISNNLLDMTTLKLLARSDYWRNYYTVNKNELFPYSASELTDEQKGILSLSLMYERIYEHPDCPERDVIEDDDALDGWMIHQQRENKRQKKEKGVNNLLSGKAKNAQEVFLMAKNNEQKDDIIGLNTEASNFRRQNKLKEVLSSDGPIADAQLSDVQNDIRNKIQQLNYKKG
jgi:hypothetical protein